MSDFRFFKAPAPFSPAPRDMYRAPSGPRDPFSTENWWSYGTPDDKQAVRYAAPPEMAADKEQERRDALKGVVGGIDNMPQAAFAKVLNANDDGTGLSGGAAGTGLSGGAAGTGLSGGAAGTGLGAGKAGRGVETGQLETYARGGVVSGDPRGGFGRGKKVGGRGHAEIAARNAARAAAKKRKEQEGQQ